MAGIMSKVSSASKVVRGLARDGLNAAGGKATTMTGKTIAETAKRFTSKDTINNIVKPGIKNAFEASGGKAGAAKRIIGGAAIGGAASGTVGALRGNDFWESARGGAVAGGIAGVGRQGYQMSQTGAGKSMMTNMGGEFNIAKDNAATRQVRGGANAGSIDGSLSELSNLSSNSSMQNMRNDYIAPRTSKPSDLPSQPAVRARRAQSASPNSTVGRRQRKGSPDISKAVKTLQGVEADKVLSDGVVASGR